MKNGVKINIKAIKYLLTGSIPIIGINMKNVENPKPKIKKFLFLNVFIEPNNIIGKANKKLRKESKNSYSILPE
jgi:hypothetical protein